jgi:hypothetical protein
MFRINIPQHFRGRTIATSERFFHEKPIDFKMIWLKLAFSRQAGTPIPQLKPSASQSLKNVRFWWGNVNRL